MAQRRKRATARRGKSAARGKARKTSNSARGKAAKRTMARSKPRKSLAKAKPKRAGAKKTALTICAYSVTDGIGARVSKNPQSQSLLYVTRSVAPASEATPGTIRWQASFFST